jgi:hypothetical protein
MNINMGEAFQLKIRSEEGLDLLVCREFEERDLPHGFSLRSRRWDDATLVEPYGLAAHVKSDFQDLANRLGTSDVVSMQQVHGTELTIIGDPPDKAPVCDGIFTRREDVALVVQTADCVPMLMWDPDQNVVAAVHAGWRGTLGRIAEKAADMFLSRFSSRSESIYVALGPAIGPCCYEVGPEVVDAYTRQLTSADELFSTGPRGRQHLDVIEANRRQLVASGISEDRIFSTEMCTSCDNGFLYSYRKEGEGTGRLYGAISVARS